MRNLRAIDSGCISTEYRTYSVMIMQMHRWLLKYETIGDHLNVYVSDYLEYLPLSNLRNAIYCDTHRMPKDGAIERYMRDPAFARIYQTLAMSRISALTATRPAL